MEEKKTTLKLIIVNTVTYVMTIYFIFHIFSGDRGLFAYIKLNKNIIEQKQQILESKTQRDILEHTAHLLNNKQPDLDLVDELVRYNFGFADKKETVYILEYE